MERKTIGGFIAALRKANGMTQKDLADRLNVSDKTVSRWERDEGTPDLSLIPVIAEIFGVTCDELLRGERRSPEERNAPQEDCYTTQKGEKQRQRLLNSALSQYRTQTYVSIGISFLGLIAALICNLVFLKAVLGFLCGTIFFVVSFACQAIFVNRALLRVEDGGLDMESISAFRRRIIALAERSIGTTVCFVGFTAPLLLVDSYMGLSADSMLLFGVIGAVAFLAVYAIICYFLNTSFVKKGIYALSEKESGVYYHTHIVTDIEYIADEILMIKNGTLLKKGAENDIIQEISGKVWECRVSREEADHLEKRYTICNSKTENGTTILRIVSDSKPCNAAALVSPCLEDLYLHYFHGEV